eukprot:gnl/MRDRNA2_/MRDRNA2_85881_c1_seq1.p1 gnl/MRDRNA2_/MRDRNA2_85881_c1~~gnl/MRDRNA2_/MRDRNA2_85881_c1_seq1.p1  ORF type:complete len:156 (+),score=9.00 gnl/MRDRNA2_/MRDRNA2_85881_c1_seq1:40-507(+)
MDWDCLRSWQQIKLFISMWSQPWPVQSCQATHEEGGRERDNSKADRRLCYAVPGAVVQALGRIILPPRLCTTAPECLRYCSGTTKKKKKSTKSNNRFRQKLVRKTKTTGRQKLEVRKTKTTVAQKLKVKGQKKQSVENESKSNENERKSIEHKRK